jgi:glycosyltransferase involved in cell wall biosynthesis
MPTFNRAKFIGKAIESVLNQNFKNHEIIVVDDGSTDGTVSVLKAYGQTTRCFSQRNSSVGAARNTGIKNAKGEWLAFLDSDDECIEAYLSKQIKRVEEVPGVCMQTTDCVFINQDGRQESHFEIDCVAAEFKGEDYLFVREPSRLVIGHGPWRVGSTIIRGEAIYEAGLFDTSSTISEDLDLMARHLEGILGHWKEGLTIAFLEGINTPFSMTMRKARGYRSGEYHVALLCFVTGNLEIPDY